MSYSVSDCFFVSQVVFKCEFLSFQMVEIWAILDGEPEVNETFAVTLSNPTGGARLGEQLQTFVTVLENLAPTGLFRITPSVNRSQ